MDSSTVICWTSPFVSLGHLFYFLWKILLANKVDHDQTPHYVEPDLGLHCTPVILLRFPGKNVSRATVFAFLQEEPHL